jgi:hypothetical protein
LFDSILERSCSKELPFAGTEVELAAEEGEDVELVLGAAVAVSDPERMSSTQGR